MGSLFGSKPKLPKPTKSDYGGATNNLLGVYNQTTQGVQDFERMARLGYGQQNLTDIGGSIFGIGGQQGIAGITGQAATQAQQQIQGLRAGEYQSMTDQTGAVRGLLGAISPEAQRMMQLQQQAAETAYGSAQGLTGQEQRGAQQAAREASMARGNIGGNASIASEVLNREDVLARKRAEASMAGQTAYQSAQNFYAPAQSLLSGTPASMGYGQQYAAAGQAQIGQATPKLFDYSTAFGMDQARVKAQDAYNQAKYQQQLQDYQSKMGMIGTLGGAALGLATGGLGFGLTGSALMGAGSLGAGLGGSFAGSSSSGGLIAAGLGGLSSAMPSGSGGYMSGVGNNSMAAARASGAY